VNDSGQRQPVYRLKRFKYNSHYWILRFLANAAKPSRILDIGAADGYLGEILKREGHHLVGLESDAGLAEEAQSHYELLHHADAESFDFPYRGEFDYVLLADVLEHLRDPAAVLRRVLPCLNEHGEVIISLPNVAHLSVRLSLLCGRFDYGDRGILDRGHLRFFTLAGIKQMMGETACRILELRPTSAPVQLVFPWSDRRAFGPLHELHFLSVRLCPTLLAYQFVLRAAPERRRHAA
jgi:SAM-dependent methyltransferase